MFTLRIHTVDTSQPPLTDGGGTSTSKKNLSSNSPIEYKGVVHLFRNLPLTTNPPIMTLWNVATRTTLVFIVAVPNYVSPQEFVAFCGNHVHEFSHLSFIRNDAVEDRYSVLIKLVNQAAADGFCIVYNGKRFSPSETEVCHIYFAQQVEYTDSLEVASNPQPGYTELPTCPVCLERLDYDTSAIQITHCDHSFQCPCISKSTYLSCQVCRLCQQQGEDGKPSCAVCGTSRNPWVCLICGFVGCGRYEKGHAMEHYRHAQHCYSLKPETQQIWDYVGEKYVQRLNQSKVGSKSIVTNHQSSEEAFFNKEDAEVGGVLFSSKVDTIVDEYNFLLATKIQTQRQELQHKLEELSKDTKTISYINEDLAKDQESREEGEYVVYSNEETSNSDSATIQRPIGRFTAKKKGKGKASQSSLYPNNDFIEELRAMRIARESEVDVMNKMLELDKKREERELKREERKLKREERKTKKMYFAHLNSLMAKDHLTPEEDDIKRNLYEWLNGK